MTEATARVVHAKKDLANLRKAAEAEVQQAQTALAGLLALVGGK